MDNEQMAAMRNVAQKSHQRNKLPKPSLSETGTVSHWSTYLEAIYDDGMPASLGEDYLYNFQQELVYRIIPTIRHWDSSMLKLFQIVAALFMFEKAESTELDRSTLNHRSRMPEVLETCELLISHAIDDLDLKELTLVKYSEVLSGIALMIHSLALNDQFFHHTDWFLLYMLLWGRLLIHPKRIKVEQSRLNERLADPDLPLSTRCLALRALAHLDFIQGHDEAAFQTLSRMPRAIKFSDYEIYLKNLLYLGYDSRLHAWLRWRTPQLKDEDEAEIVAILSIWKEANESFVSDSEYVQVMRQLLPYSYDDYSEWLLVYEEYALWVDLHISLGFFPSDIDPLILKIIEEEDLKLLLPFYHQAVEAHIEARNRTNYRQAVRCLQKLNQYYKRLGQTDRWITYLQRMMHRYHRLHAFQDELRKGQIA